MKNPHLNGHCKILNTVSGDKKLKRKARDPIKRTSDDHLPYFKLYKNSHLMAETLGDSCPKETHGSEIVAASGGNELLNTAVDMRINTVISGEIPDSKLRSISEKTVNNKIAKTSSQVSALSSSQVFPLERVVLSQRAASQAPAASGISERAESPRRRAGEQSGVVTEIKAIQQTRRLLANARERTRVHTISAAFEALRKQVNSRMRITLYYLPIKTKYGVKKLYYNFHFSTKERNSPIADRLIKSNFIFCRFDGNVT